MGRVRCGGHRTGSTRPVTRERALRAMRALKGSDMFDWLSRWRRRAAPHAKADPTSATIAEQVQRWERTHPGGTWPDLPKTGLLGRVRAVEEATGAINPPADWIERRRR